MNNLRTFSLIRILTGISKFNFASFQCLEDCHGNRADKVNFLTGYTDSTFMPIVFSILSMFSGGFRKSPGT